MKKFFKGRFAPKSSEQWNEIINKHFYDYKIITIVRLINETLLKNKETKKELIDVERDLKHGRLIKEAESLKNKIKESQKEIKKIKYKIKVFKEKKERDSIEKKIRRAINYEKNYFTIEEMNSIIKRGKTNGRRK